MKNLSVYLEESIFQKYRDALIAAIFTFGILLLGIVNIKLTIAFGKPKLDEKFTKKLRDITGDENIEIYSLNNPKFDPNAFFAGGKSLYYTKSLDKMLKNEEELIAILLHEFGHYKGKHVTRNMVTVGVTFYATIYTILKTTKNEDPIVKMLMFLLMQTGFNIATLPLGRYYEYFSDKYTVQYGYHKHLISALKKLEKYIRKEMCKNMSKEQCDQTIENLHALDEHPVVKKRIEAVLKEKAKKDRLGENYKKKGFIRRWIEKAIGEI